MSNRVIKFRGLRIDNKEWIYGDYIRRVISGIEGHNISHIDLYDLIPIQKTTIGQFTGLADKNGTEIYEGDTDITGILVKWDEIAASFICVRDGSFIGHLGEISNLLLITGNIHENPELLNT